MFQFDEDEWRGRYCGDMAEAMLTSLGQMLKVSTKEREDSISFVLEGRLCGEWAVEAEQAWSRLLANSPGREILLDLSGITFIDPAGEALIKSMLARSPKVRGSGVVVNYLIDQMQEKVSRR